MARAQLEEDKELSTEELGDFGEVNLELTRQTLVRGAAGLPGCWLAGLLGSATD